TIISGMGELHLDIIVDRMKREFKVEANIGAPQVAYREAITRMVEHDYTHKKQSGGSGQFAHIKFRIEPNEAGAGFEFVSEVVGDVIGDLNSRRGQIRGTEGRGIAQVVDAMVPLANMFGYVNSLRSMSQGRAQYTMTFDHYEQVPNAVAQEVQAKYA